MTGIAGMGVVGGGGQAAVLTMIATNMSVLEERVLRGSGRWK